MPRLAKLVALLPLLLTLLPLAACSGAEEPSASDAGAGTPVPTREAGPLEAEVVAMIDEGDELRWILAQEDADALSERMGFLLPMAERAAPPETGYRGLRVAVTERSSAAPASAWAWQGRVLFEIQQGETGGDYRATLRDEGRRFERFLLESGQPELDPADYARLEAAFEAAGELGAPEGDAVEGDAVEDDAVGDDAPGGDAQEDEGAEGDAPVDDAPEEDAAGESP